MKAFQLRLRVGKSASAAAAAAAAAAGADSAKETGDEVWSLSVLFCVLTTRSVL